MRRGKSRVDVSSKISYGEEEDWMTNTSIITPPLPPQASGLGEEVMTLRPGTAKSHDGIQPASAYTSLTRMMMTFVGMQSSSEQTHNLITNLSFYSSGKTHLLKALSKSIT